MSAGIITDPTVNVHEAVATGTQKMKHYGNILPSGFHDTLPTKVRTMAITNKHTQVGSAKVYDTNLMNSCITGLKASGRDMNPSEVLKYKLAPIHVYLIFFRYEDYSIKGVT